MSKNEPWSFHSSLDLDRRSEMKSANRISSSNEFTKKNVVATKCETKCPENPQSLHFVLLEMQLKK